MKCGKRDLLLYAVTDRSWSEGTTLGTQVEEALRAERHGADYLGVGAAFTTSSKPEAGHIDAETIRAICETVKIPVIAIGGIKEENLLQLRGNGLCGVAVISAIFAQKDIEAATRRLHALAEEMAGDQE